MKTLLNTKTKITFLGLGLLCAGLAHANIDCLMSPKNMNWDSSPVTYDGLPLTDFTSFYVKGNTSDVYASNGHETNDKANILANSQEGSRNGVSCDVFVKNDSNIRLFKKIPTMIGEHSTSQSKFLILKDNVRATYLGETSEDKIVVRAERKSGNFYEIISKKSVLNFSSSTINCDTDHWRAIDSYAQTKLYEGSDFQNLNLKCEHDGYSICTSGEQTKYKSTPQFDFEYVKLCAQMMPAALAVGCIGEAAKPLMTSSRVQGVLGKKMMNKTYNRLLEKGFIQKNDCQDLSVCSDTSIRTEDKDFFYGMKKLVCRDTLEN
jgi:hypothetical protein